MNSTDNDSRRIGGRVLKSHGSSMSSSRRFIGVLVGVSLLSWLAYWILTSRQSGGHSEPIALKSITVESPKRDRLRPEVIRALGMGSDVVREEQLDLLRALGDDLNAEEREALFSALIEKRSVAIPAGWHSEFVHEISCALQSQSEGKERFAQVLATIANDPSRDEVVRDYALQHLRRVWASSRDIKGLCPSIEATFLNIASTDVVMSASALLSLHLLGTIPGDEISSHAGIRKPLGIDKFDYPDYKLESVLTEILSAASIANNVKSRMTALRIVGDRSIPAFSGQVRRISTDASEHALVRMAAISTLAKLGDPSDRQLLESLDDGDPRIAGAIRHALARFP